MKILLVGGGTGGSVSPLLAVAEELKNRNVPGLSFAFVGTKNGPEREMVAKRTMDFYIVPAGKLRRYFSWQNFFLPFLIATGFLKSLFLLRKIRPSVVVGTGSFVQVPVAWAAWILRIPIVLHQQDVVPSLANKLCELCAKRITVTFEKSLKDFASDVGVFAKQHDQKVFVTGNPANAVHENIDRHQALKAFNLSENFPVLLVTGGGTGAMGINNLVEKAAPELIKFVQILHLTGKGKSTRFSHEHYHQYEFVSNMPEAYAAANIVVSRAGMSTITELSQLQKLVILIPMPQSHQENNARFLAGKNAALVLDDREISPEEFTRLIKKVLFDAELQTTLTRNIDMIMPKDAAAKVADILLQSVS